MLRRGALGPSHHSTTSACTLTRTAGKRKSNFGNCTNSISIDFVFADICTMVRVTAPSLEPVLAFVLITVGTNVRRVRVRPVTAGGHSTAATDSATAAAPAPAAATQRIATVCCCALCPESRVPAAAAQGVCPVDQPRPRAWGPLGGGAVERTATGRRGHKRFCRLITSGVDPLAVLRRAAAAP